jgi:hypothetical protein
MQAETECRRRALAGDAEIRPRTALRGKAAWIDVNLIPFTQTLARKRRRGATCRPHTPAASRIRAAAGACAATATAHPARALIHQRLQQRCLRPKKGQCARWVGNRARVRRAGAGGDSCGRCVAGPNLRTRPPLPRSQSIGRRTAPVSQPILRWPPACQLGGSGVRERGRASLCATKLCVGAPASPAGRPHLRREPRARRLTPTH